MKPILPVLLLGLAMGALFPALGGELEEVRRLERERDAVRKELSEAKNANRRLVDEERNLRDTAAVTRADPRKPSPPAVREPARTPLFRHALDRADGFKLPPGAEVAETDGVKALRVSAAEAGPSALIRRTLDVPDGGRLRFRVQVKAEGVARVEGKRLSGIRFGGMYRRDGKSQWPSARHCDGSFDWQEMAFEAELPFGARRFLLLMGLTEGGTGTVYFRNLEVEVADILRCADVCENGNP